MIAMAERPTFGQAIPTQDQRSTAPARRIAFALTLLFILLLSACVPGGKKPAKPSDTPATGPVNPGLPVDLERHRIAVLVPLTGPNAAVGESISNMVQMAVLDTKSDKLRITTYDTAKGASIAAQQAVADGNRLILGPLLSEDVIAVAPIARKANVPLLSFSNDATVAGNGVFLLGYSPAQSVDRVVDYARSQGKTRFAALIPATTYGDRALASYKAAVEKKGGTLVAAESYDRTAVALSGAVRRLSRIPGGYDTLLIADGGSTVVQAAPQVRSLGGKSAQILGTELWNTESALANNVALRGAWFASVSDGLYSQLATKYRTRYGLAPYRLSSLGYDSVLLTVRVAREWKPGTNFPQQRLFATDGFGGIDGIFRFDQKGVAIRALEVSEVRAGGFAVVSAAPVKW
jgi:ABC-type branched-subunit amino acid transport system substrate-binding protein